MIKNLNELKVGMLVADENGIYEIMKEYDEFHSWYECKEVFIDDEGNLSYDNNPIYLTREEMKRCELY